MNIHETINAILAEVPAIGKNQKNSQQGFMYRGIDVVMNTLQPLFSKYKLFAVPEVMEQTREERQTKSGSNLIYSICKIKYTFYAEDGSSVSAVVIGEGMDSGDKATNKAMAIAFKYACFQVFCIPTEEMKDPDADTPEPSTPKNTLQAPTGVNPIMLCEDCGGVILPYKGKDGNLNVAEFAAKTKGTYGKSLCLKCAKEYAAVTA